MTLTSEQLAAIQAAEDSEASGSATNQADNINGGAGDDAISGLQGNDTIYGGVGNDTLNGDQGGDSIFGGSGNDTLNGGNGNDTLTGGAGDDQLTGGNGDDTFVFRFAIDIVQGETETVYFRPNEDGTGGDMPDANASPQAWINYLAQLADWRAALEAQYGADLDTSMESVVLTNRNIDRFLAKYGTDIAAYGAEAWADFDLLNRQLSFDNSFTFGTESSRTITGEGFDTVIDWEAGNDTLRFVGLSNDETADTYWGDWLTADTLVDGKTVISYDGGSITLMGVDTSIAELIGAGDIVFV